MLHSILSFFSDCNYSLRKTRAQMNTTKTKCTKSPVFERKFRIIYFSVKDQFVVESHVTCILFNATNNAKRHCYAAP